MCSPDSSLSFVEFFVLSLRDPVGQPGHWVSGRSDGGSSGMVLLRPTPTRLCGGLVHPVLHPLRCTQAQELAGADNAEVNFVNLVLAFRVLVVGRQRRRQTSRPKSNSELIRLRRSSEGWTEEEGAGPATFCCVTLCTSEQAVINRCCAPFNFPL